MHNNCIWQLWQLWQLWQYDNMTIRIILISIMKCIYYNLIIIYIYIIIRLIPKCFGISYCHIVILSLLSYCHNVFIWLFFNTLITFSITIAIFSQCSTYILSYIYMPNFAFTLIFNILDIEVHYVCHVFTVHRVYNGQNFYTYHTVSYRIHPWTLRKDRRGFYAHISNICAEI